MNRMFTRRQLIAASGLALLGRAAWADDYPARTINYMVPYAPGGLSDIIARMLADGIMRLHGKNVVVDYKPGAGGAIAAELLTRSPADGYTVMGATNAFFGVMPHLNPLKFDPLQDLTPVALIGDTAMAIVGSASLPVKTLPQLIAYAKAHPGKLSYGSAGMGTVSHLAGEYLKKRAGIHIVHIPYRGSPAAVQACLANEVDLIFGPEGAEGALAGKLKALATLGSRRWSKLPDVPSTDEAGIPDWALRSWHTVCVPGKTPLPVARRLNEIINLIVADPSVSGRLQQMGTFHTPLTLTQLAERVKADHAAFGRLIKDAGITAA
jgi:tripartite-type tricarboxylate transporter receptor subunit TctC